MNKLLFDAIKKPFLAMLVGLTFGTPCMPESAKRELVASINGFLGDGGRPRFAKSIDLESGFGWIGLPLLAVGVLGLLRLPAVLLRALWKARP